MDIYLSVRLPDSLFDLPQVVIKMKLFWVF